MLEGQKYHGNTIMDGMTEKSGMPVFDRTKDWLDRYFDGEKPVADELPLAPVGSKFRQEVWRILCEIPYGEVITYGDIAKKMAAKMEEQACQARQSAVRWGITLFPSSYPAIGWWAATAA